MSTTSGSASRGAAFTHCPEMLFIADVDGALLDVNDALGRRLGAQRAAGAPLLDLVQPEYQSTFTASWRKLRDEGAARVRFASRLRDVLGGYFTVTVSAARGEGGEVFGALLTTEDEAPRSSPSRQVDDERRLLRVLLDKLPLVVWAIDGSGVLLFQDGSATEQTGLRQGQFMGLNLVDQYKDNPVIQGSLRRALAGEELHSVTEAHGAWWETWHLPVRDEAGRVVVVFGVTLNVTEAKRAEKELRDKLALIERQEEAIRALATPIIEVWDSVLTLPLIGVVDSRRAAAVMEQLLGEIARRRARFAVLDLTGVSTMDTATAGHLLALLRAIRLLGAEGIITGIRPDVAETMISLGLDFSQLITLGSLRDGLRLCMRRLGELLDNKGDQDVARS